MTDPLLVAARAAIAEGSRSFALAARLFDPVTRDRATLLYAWCRHCDDVIDGQAGGQGVVDDPRPMAERLAVVDAGTRAALAGEPTGVMAFDALARVAAETGLPERYALDLIEGFRMDVDGDPYDTELDLLRYCYHVAGCVGVMMAIVMGVSPDDRATLDRACDLGIAFQLNNIARDVAEDAARGRCYLPADWLAAEDLSAADLADPARTQAVARVTRRLVDEAERYEASAKHGVPALPGRSAWAVLAAAAIYGGIGRKVRALGEVSLQRRVATSKRMKLGAVASAFPAAWWRKRRWPEPAPRDGLWTMASWDRA